MENNSLTTSSKQWYIARWPWPVWLETGIKAVALAIGILIMVLVLPTSRVISPNGLPLLQLLIQVTLILLLTTTIYDRWVEREIISLVFVIVNNIAHWGIAVALVSNPRPEIGLAAFFVLMLLGDVAKLVSIYDANVTVTGQTRLVLYGRTLLFVAGYALLLILELLT